MWFCSSHQTVCHCFPFPLNCWWLFSLAEVDIASGRAVDTFVEVPLFFIGKWNGHEIVLLKQLQQKRLWLKIDQNQLKKTVEKYFALVFQIQQALEPSSGLMSSSVPLLPSIKSLQLKHQRAHKALKKEKVLGCLAFPIHHFNLCMI